MAFTEQQVQMMASCNAIICEMYQQVCKKQMEDEDRKHEYRNVLTKCPFA